MRIEPEKFENAREKTGQFSVAQETKFGLRTEGVMGEVEKLVRQEKDPAKMAKLVQEYAEIVLDEAESAGKLPAGAVAWVFEKGGDERQVEVRRRILHHVAKEFDDLGKPHRPTMREVTRYFLNYAIPSIASPFEMSRKRAVFEQGKRAAAN